MKPTINDLAKELLESTKSIPGFEDTGLRYVGNNQRGFSPCIATGRVMVSDAGVPIVWPTMAHLRVWAFNYMVQKSKIVIPSKGMSINKA